VAPKLAGTLLETGRSSAPSGLMRVERHLLHENGAIADHPKGDAEGLVDRPFLLLRQRFGRVAVPDLTAEAERRTADLRQRSSASRTRQRDRISDLGDDRTGGRPPQGDRHLKRCWRGSEVWSRLFLHQPGDEIGEITGGGAIIDIAGEQCGSRHLAFDGVEGGSGRR
jgi:hypothetical protein